MNLAIVTSNFNKKITLRMLQVALEKAQCMKINVKYICKVHGIFDMPILVDVLLTKNDVDAVVTLGAIIKGKTKHDEVIANATISKLLNISLIHKKPVSLGISGPGMTEKHAYSRIRSTSENAIKAAVDSFAELEKLKIN